MGKRFIKIGIISLFFFGLFAGFVFADSLIKKPSGHINDIAKIISDEDKLILENKLNDFGLKYDVWVDIATVNTLNSDSIEIYAAKLFEAWGIGDSKKDNGVLLLVAPNERKVRIEVGYGLEETLTDSKSNTIIQDLIIPRFKTGDYSGGIYDGVDGIISVFTFGNSEDSNGVLVSSTQIDNSKIMTNSDLIYLIIKITLTLIAFAIALSLLSRLLVKIFPKYAKIVGSSGGFGGGSSGSSSSGSSSSSSGGGSSGGGGASGSW